MTVSQRVLGWRPDKNGRALHATETPRKSFADLSSSESLSVSEAGGVGLELQNSYNIQVFIYVTPYLR